MNENDLLYMIFNNAVNQAVLNKKNVWQSLPQDQQEALNKMLDAIHDFNENRNKIRPIYQRQAMDAVLLKMASEMGIH